MCLGSPLEGSIGGLPKTPESTIGEGSLPPHSQVSRCGSKESRGDVACVGASPWRLPHPREPVWRLGFQGRLGCPKSGHGCPESGHGCPGGVELVLRLHQEYSGVMKLVMELHHVSQGHKEGEFRDGGASVWASPCEFQWLPREVPKWLS